MSELKSRIFGVALDPSDDPQSLELKRAWMLSGGTAEVGISTGLDPYDTFLDRYPKILADLDLEPCGKYAVPSWLWPRPPVSDLPRVTAAEIGKYYDSGQFAALLGGLGDFVEKEILPARPVMLGIDHSATTGVISALSRRYGREQLSAIVLDQHFDAIPQSVRAAQMTDKPCFRLLDRPNSADLDHLCCGNFWPYVIREGWIWPQHLSLIGVADYPGPNPGNGAELFRDSYLGGANAGVSFFPLQNFRRRYKPALIDFLRRAIKTPYVYLSLDLDVASYRGVLAARYMDVPGISARTVLEVAGQIQAVCQEKGAELAGLDVMEFNQHFLGLRTEDGLRDQTLSLVQKFLRIVLS